MSFISGGNPIREYYYAEDVRRIRVLYNRLVNATNDEGQHLPWNAVMFALIYKNNWKYSKKEYAGGLNYNLLNHNCRCRNPECIAMRPKVGRPGVRMERETGRLIMEFNSDPMNERYEIVAGQREILRGRPPSYETVFVLGILDNQRDLENALERLAGPYMGYQEKFDRLLWMRDNMREVNRSLRQYERMIDTYLNGKA
jgi:hypothetical protein